MMTNKRYGMVALVATAACALALSAHAQIITTNVLVNDTWRSGNVVWPAPPAYAENNGLVATPVNFDGDLSSAWFMGGSGNLAIVTNNPTPPVTGPNILEMTTSTGSSHYYTYFTSNTTAVTLSATGVSQEMVLTWDFTPNGLGAQNGNQGLFLALGLTPSGTRVTANGTLPKANYTNAFAALLNVEGGAGQEFGTTPLTMKKWSLAGTGSLAGTTSNYATLQTGGTSLTQAYMNGTNYSFVMSLDMLPTGLQVTETVSGYKLGGTGSITATYLDTSLAGQSVSYDTFVIRPTNGGVTASTFDTSLFQVIIIPEPSTVALVVMGLGVALGLIRRRRS